jgi:hypothetical protein
MFLGGEKTFVIKATFYLGHGMSSVKFQSNFYLVWSQCYKNTTVNYRGNFNLIISKVKMPW